MTLISLECNYDIRLQLSCKKKPLPRYAEYYLIATNYISLITKRKKLISLKHAAILHLDVWYPHMALSFDLKQGILECLIGASNNGWSFYSLKWLAIAFKGSLMAFVSHH